MKPVCPRCKGVIPPEQINAGTDVAFCPACGETFRLSELIEEGSTEQVDLGAPPRGAWFKASIDEWEVGATTRSPVAFILVPFMCVWSAGALGGIYGSQIIQGQFNPVMSLFGIPFILGTCLFGWLAVMSACGRMRVRCRGEAAEIFVGVGNVGWRRRFRWADIQRARDGSPTASYPGRQGCGIRLEGTGKVINFAEMISEESRVFVLGVIRRMLVRAADGVAVR